jgi:hypothetical protein
MMLRRFFIVPLLCVLVLGGCSTKPSINGAWNFAVSGAENVTATFSEGGSLSMEATVQTFKVGATGSFTLENDSLTISVSKFEFPKDFPDALKAIAETEAKKQFTLGASTIVWVSADEVKVTPPAGGIGVFAKPFTMSRKKP